MTSQQRQGELGCRPIPTLALEWSDYQPAAPFVAPGCSRPDWPSWLAARTPSRVIIREHKKSIGDPARQRLETLQKGAGNANTAHRRSYRQCREDHGEGEDPRSVDPRAAT